MKSESRRKFLKTAGLSAISVPLMGNVLANATKETALAPTRTKDTKMASCDYRLLRHAAAVFNYNDQQFLIDPMLNAVVNNVPLPVGSSDLEAILNSLDAVLLTHAHTDHINLEAWQVNLLKDKPFFCQSAVDGAYLTSIGMNDVRVINTQIDFNGITIYKTDGQHGVTTGWDVSGFVFTASGNQSVYIAGDTTYAAPVAEALDTYKPDITIVNCGAVGPTADPWTMTAEHVGEVAAKLPSTQIIAVHMEVHPSAKVTRAQLRQYTDANNISNRVLIPADGESINLCNATSVHHLSLDPEAIEIVPNPFTEKVVFKIPGRLLHIRVVDMNGRLIHTLHEPAWDGTDGSGALVRNGLYLLLITTHERLYAQQVLKQ